MADATTSACAMETTGHPLRDRRSALFRASSATIVWAGDAWYAYPSVNTATSGTCGDAHSSMKSGFTKPCATWGTNRQRSWDCGRVKVRPVPVDIAVSRTW